MWGSRASPGDGRTSVLGLAGGVLEASLESDLESGLVSGLSPVVETAGGVVFAGGSLGTPNLGRSEVVEGVELSAGAGEGAEASGVV
jgi:hypothetical protein